MHIGHLNGHLEGRRGCLRTRNGGTSYGGGGGKLDISHGYGICGIGYTYGIYGIWELCPPPPRWGPSRRIAPGRGPKALNMKAYAHLAPNATLLTHIPLLFTHGQEELRFIVNSTSRTCPFLPPSLPLCPRWCMGRGGG